MTHGARHAGRRGEVFVEEESLPQLLDGCQRWLGESDARRRDEKDGK